MAPRGLGPSQASPVLHQLQGGVGGGDRTELFRSRAQLLILFPLKHHFQTLGLLAKAFGLFSFRGLVGFKELRSR